jgi:hypothetical protein
MKTSRLFASFLLALLLLACGKDDAPSNGEVGEEGNWPYSRYMLTDYLSYVEIPHHPDLNPSEGMTWEGWVRLDTKSGTLLYKKLYNENEGYIIYVQLDGETFLCSYMGYSQSRQQAPGMPILQWVHWAVTSDGTQRRHYINGELVGEFAENGQPFVPSTEPLFVARTVPANTGLAEFRLWNIARSQKEIKSNMNKEIRSPKPGLVAIWPFEEDANDVIGNHHGTLHNDPKFKIWSE